MPLRMETTRVKSNDSKYQKHIERSFAVIYHNLKRIHDDNRLQEGNGKHSQTEPPSHEPLQLHPLDREKSHSLKKAPSKNMSRRVTFSFDTVTGSSPRSFRLN